MASIHDEFMAPTRTTPAGVGDLPLELHQQILSYLPWRDQLNCEHVCRAWREDLRGRLSKPRSIIAPWLPQQDFDIGLYGALTVHTLVTNGRGFSFKCHQGYRLYPGAPIIAEDTFMELGNAVMDEDLEVLDSIHSFHFIQKQGTGSDAKFVQYPVANLSFLDDLFVMPAFVDEDEIRKLYCRLNLQELAPKPQDEGENGEASGSLNQAAAANNTVGTGNDNDGDDDDDDNDDDDDGDDNSDSDDEDQDTSNGPTRTNLCSNNFTTNVNLNQEGHSTDTTYRLMLGSLLLKMREHILQDVIRIKNLDPNNASYPENLDAGDILRLDERRATEKKGYENGTVFIDNLQFERCREGQALSISFNGMILSDEALQAITTRADTEPVTQA
ncbi:hypothetical protein TWF481_006514 [Arthrobotrys musiformis]|uniref:F-box domain-containing protein n=1 Tax=Arthrobotrys musiformis TaxID=47236 RepID=A0AAV9W9N2_9PEZI